MPEKQNLQDRLLNFLRKRKIEAKLYLINGFQVNGFIKSFDNYTVLIENGKQQNMIYKHAISTVMPAEYVKLSDISEETREKSKENSEKGEN